jgi:hypothetical protein
MLFRPPGDSSDHRRRSVYYAAFLWSVAFGAPHTWWAFGSPLGFPGGPANHRLLMTSGWRYAYDVVVILLSILGAVVALVLARPLDLGRLHRLFRILAWTAALLLGVRGIAGLIVDGTSDPIWWPTFLVGGLLFGRIAQLSRRESLRSTTAQPVPI